MKSCKYFYVFISILLFQGCGSNRGDADNSSDDFVPTDPTTVFQLELQGGPTVGTSIARSIPGIDNDGDAWTADFSAQVQADTMFLGEVVRGTLVLVQLTHIPSGGILNSSETSYIQYNVNDTRLIGYDGDTTTVAFTAFPIPYTALIGDSGSKGTYTNNNGDVTVVTWEIKDAGSGQANIIERATTRDQFNTLILTAVETIRLLPDGTVAEYSISFTDHVTGLVLNFSN